jgi:hypothetical protein
VDERALRERLARLERAMPDALPRDLRAVVVPRHSSRIGDRPAWASLLPLLAAVVAGIVVGGAGLLLLAPRQTGTPVLPAGIYRSGSPVQDAVCVAVELPVRGDAPGLAQRRVWWWPPGPAGCSQRSDFIYVQWVQPTLARITADGGSPRDGVRLELAVELRDGARYAVDLTLDPMAVASDSGGSVPTYADGGLSTSVTLLPIDSLDSIEEAAP